MMASPLVQYGRYLTNGSEKVPTLFYFVFEHTTVGADIPPRFSKRYKPKFENYTLHITSREIRKQTTQGAFKQVACFTLRDRTVASTS